MGSPMQTLKCFVITPSGKNPPMRLVEDDKYGLSAAPSSCEQVHTSNGILLNFQKVYDYIIKPAIKQINDTHTDLYIECTRGEDLPQGGNIVSQFLQQICRADITITDVTGFNPNVLLEYGIRLSVRDSLNMLICHEGAKLPLDIADQRCIPYRTDDMSVGTAAIAQLVATITNSLPQLLKQRALETSDNLFRRTVEVATGRTLDRRLATVFDPAPSLLVDLVNEVKRLNDELKQLGADDNIRAKPRLRDNAWDFLEALAKTLKDDPCGLNKAVDVYERMTRIDGFKDKRRDVFYTLNEIYAADPERQSEAQYFLNKAIELED